MPLLSIITVTRNCSDTVERTLASVRRVKTPDIEYIAVDGVSSDGTREILAANEDLIDRFVSEPDTGIYNAMNKGIALAHGDYVLFINGDDELVAEGFPKLLEALHTGRADIVCATTIVGLLSEPQEVLTARPWRLPFYNSIPHPSTCVTTALMRSWGFREDLRVASDYDLFLRAFLARCTFAVVPAVTALHRRGGASNTPLAAEEVELIKHSRLGWRYPIVQAIERLHRKRRAWEKRLRRACR